MKWLGKFLTSKNSGYIAVVLAIVFFALVGMRAVDYANDLLTAKRQSEELQEAIRRGNQQIAARDKQIQLLDKANETLVKDVKWQADRINKQNARYEKVRLENEELQNTLDSLIPRALIE